MHVPAVPAHPRGAHQVQVLEVPVRLHDLDHLARGDVVGGNLALAVPNREKLTRGVDAKASQPIQQVFGARLDAVLNLPRLDRLAAPEVEHADRPVDGLGEELTGGNLEAVHGVIAVADHAQRDTLLRGLFVQILREGPRLDETALVSGVNAAPVGVDGQ